VIKKDANPGMFTSHDLWSLLDRAHFAICRLRGLELAQFGLTIEQSSILYILNNRGGCATTGELEDITMRQHHSISSLMGRMTKMGLIKREKGGKGKRFNIVTSEDGQDLSRKAPINSLKMTFSCLTAREKWQLASILSSLLDRARDLLGISYRPPFLQNIINNSAADLILKKRVREDAPFPEHELWSLLDRAGFIISRLRELELARFGLTNEQSSILYILNNRGGCATTRELEDITMRQQCSISTLINRMMAMGLISKKKGGKGKRFNLLITGEGQMLADKVPVSSLELTFSVLKDGDKRLLAASLSTLLDRARDLLGISYRPPFLQDIDTGVFAPSYRR
jgi:DNA-binding MarR family transcriptional regulator